MLTRDQILSAADRDRQTVEVPEWGGSVSIAALSVADRAEVLGEFLRISKVEGEAEKARAMVDAQVRMVALSIVDDAGHPLFTAADCAALAGKSGEAIGRVADAVTVLNKFAAKAAEDDAKN